MSHIHICRENKLDEQECQDLAEKLLEKLVGKFGGNYKAKGSSFVYKHTAGVSADVVTKAGELVVDVKLGIMTRALAPKLEEEMNRVLDQHLG